MVLEPLLDRPPFRVDLIAPAEDRAGGDLVISFASVGHDPTRPPAPEFIATATGRGTARPRRALFISDDSRSWGNHPDFAPMLVEAVSRADARAPVTRIATLGLSMGAYCALIAAQVLPVSVVLAFGPQATLLPAELPEDRWSRWTDHLPPLTWPRAPLPGSGWAVITHGLRDDRAQARAFLQQPGTDHLIFPDQGHSTLVPHLKARGALAGMMEAALTDDRRRLLRIAASAGGKLRQRLPEF